MSYPDVVIACIEHKVSLEAFRAIDKVQKHDNNMKDYSLYTDHHNHNHSNYLVCDRANTQSVTVRKVVKLHQLLQCPRNLLIRYRPVRREERGMFILHHF